MRRPQILFKIGTVATRSIGRPSRQLASWRTWHRNLNEWMNEWMQEGLQKYFQQCLLPLLEQSDYQAGAFALDTLRPTS